MNIGPFLVLILSGLLLVSCPDELPDPQGAAPEIDTESLAKGVGEGQKEDPEPKPKPTSLSEKNGEKSTEPVAEPKRDPVRKAEGGILRNKADGAELVRIPEGYFPLGRDGGPAEEGPAHEAFLAAYYIYRHEVTRAMFARFLNETASPYSGEGLLKAEGGWKPEKDSDDLPQVQVTWDEAAAYAKWAGGALPTEAQWEAAARGTSPGPFPWGAKPVNVGLCNCRGFGPGTLVSIGALPDGQSPFGCLHMAGNALEWCRDTFAEDAYRSRGKTTKNPLHDQPSFSRVLRGGGFVSPPKACTVTSRTGLDPKTRLPWIGFRVVVEKRKE
ncbi:MAG: formylglycine-generating enzyme family protein [Planctomycetota bacterium]|jgi:formylglycine-generating enzyme required for sulfatase activity